MIVYALCCIKFRCVSWRCFKIFDSLVYSHMQNWGQKKMTNDGLWSHQLTITTNSAFQNGIGSILLWHFGSVRAKKILAWHYFFCPLLPMKVGQYIKILGTRDASEFSSAWNGSDLARAEDFLAPLGSACFEKMCSDEFYGLDFIQVELSSLMHAGSDNSWNSRSWDQDRSLCMTRWLDR